MLLAVDVGNTDITFGVFNDRELPALSFVAAVFQRCIKIDVAFRVLHGQGIRPVIYDAIQIF